MSRKKKNRIKPPFVSLPNYMTNSWAWKQLSTNGVWVYVEFKKKYKGNNENNLSLTYNEVKYKMSSATFSKAKKELVKYGFLDLVRAGGLYKQCCIYSLSSRWEEISKNAKIEKIDTIDMGRSIEVFKN